MYIYKEFQEGKKYVGSMGSFLDLINWVRTVVSGNIIASMQGDVSTCNLVGFRHLRVAFQGQKYVLQLQYGLHYNFCAVK